MQLKAVGRKRIGMKEPPDACRESRMAVIEQRWEAVSSSVGALQDCVATLIEGPSRPCAAKAPNGKIPLSSIGVAQLLDELPKRFDLLQAALVELRGLLADRLM